MPNRRLTLDDPESGLSVSVEFDRWDLDRAQWHYVISAGGEVLAEGSDLRDGAGSPCEARALATLLGFLSAYAESVSWEARTGRESENASLFPESLRAAAEIVGSDGFAMLAESVEIREGVEA